MRKIRRFKIPVHHREIARRIQRARLDIAACGVPDDIALAEFVSSLALELEPGVVYDTCELASKTLISPKKDTSFVSRAAVTLGPKTEQKIAAIAEPALKEAAAIAAAEFLECAADFVAELIKEEAVKENFELADWTIISAPCAALGQTEAAKPRFVKNALPANQEQELPPLLETLNAAKIGIALENGTLTPLASAIFSIAWQAKKKAGKNAKR